MCCISHKKNDFFNILLCTYLLKGNHFLMIFLKCQSNVTKCKKIYLIFRRILFTFILESSAELYLNSS